MALAGKPSALPLADWTRAQKPVNSGAARLVPPICSEVPRTSTSAPLLGEASNAMSGVPRLVDVPSTPAAVCQLGAASVSDGPPPAPPLALCWQVEDEVQAHTVSEVQVVPVVLSSVPPTEITYGETDG